ncbi:MAG: tyrosine-type recombinase/integrase [Selenomonadaceae bacterium]|nr:tyrosine-type recombinase/integrase [Selenomonadaceae bacterium]
MAKILTEAERIAGKAYTNSGGQSYVAYAVLLTAYHTGLRIGEVFGLLWENINLKERLIHVVADIVEAKNEAGKYTLIPNDTKTAASIRYIKISHKLCEVLAKLRSQKTHHPVILFLRPVRIII